MEKEKVIEWLDRKIEADKIMREEYGSLQICGEKTEKVKEGILPALHVYECIHELANAVETPVICNNRDCNEYPYFRYFIYKGYCVFDVSKTEDGR